MAQRYGYDLKGRPLWSVTSTCSHTELKDSQSAGIYDLLFRTQSTRLDNCITCMLPIHYQSLPWLIPSRFYFMSLAEYLMPRGVEKLGLMINFKERGPPNMRQAKDALSILQNHYPERLGYGQSCSECQDRLSDAVLQRL